MCFVSRQQDEHTSCEQIRAPPKLVIQRVIQYLKTVTVERGCTPETVIGCMSLKEYHVPCENIKVSILHEARFCSIQYSAIVFLFITKAMGEDVFKSLSKQIPMLTVNLN